jgi:hypothetical protein
MTTQAVDKKTQKKTNRTHKVDLIAIAKNAEWKFDWDEITAVGVSGRKIDFIGIPSRYFANEEREIGSAMTSAWMKARKAQRTLDAAQKALGTAQKEVIETAANLARLMTLDETARAQAPTKLKQKRNA